MSQQDIAAGCRWSSKEVSALISIWGNTKIQKKFDGTVRDAEVYKLICTLMADKNYPRTVSQIKTKIKSLKREYRKTKEMLNTNGNDIKFRYFHKVDRILGDKIKCEPIELLDTISIEDEEENSSSNFMGGKIKCETIEVVDNISIEENEQEKVDYFVETLGKQGGSNQIEEFLKPDDSQSVKNTSNITPENKVETPVTPENKVEIPVTAENKVKTPVTAENKVETPVILKNEVDMSVIPENRVKTKVGIPYSRPLKRRRGYMKQFLKNTMLSTLENFILFKKEMESDKQEFRRELLELERKKIKLLEEIARK